MEDRGAGDGRPSPGEEERCAAKFVGLTPDLRIGSTFGEQFHHAGVDVVRGSMHCRITLVVHAVDVGSEIELLIHTFQRFMYRAPLARLWAVES